MEEGGPVVCCYIGMCIPRSDADGGRKTCSVLLDRNEYTQK